MKNMGGKKKVGRFMGSAWAMCPWNKKKKMGAKKKKVGETPIFFKLIFGAQLWYIPSCGFSNKKNPYKILGF